jgi:hypothetical protein
VRIGLAASTDLSFPIPACSIDLLHSRSRERGSENGSVGIKDEKKPE